MSSYTSVANVKARIGAENLSSTLTDAQITTMIGHASAFIDSYTGSSFSDTPNSGGIIEMACTDIAAAYVLIRTLGGRSSGMSYTMGRLTVTKGEESQETRKMIDLFFSNAKQALNAYGRKFVVTRSEP